MRSAERRSALPYPAAVRFWTTPKSRRATRDRVKADQQLRRQRRLPFPPEVEFADLADLIEGYLPAAQGTDDDPTIADAWFDLVAEWSLGDIGPETAQDQAEGRGGTEEEQAEEIAYWNALVVALTYPDSGEVVAPIVVDPTAGETGVRKEFAYPTILDGYTRAALAVGVGRTTLPAYVRRPEL